MRAKEESINQSNNMNKVTYLFGAGASIQALPIVDQIPERIKDLIDYLEKDEFKLEDDKTFEKCGNITRRNFQLEMIESLKWMQNKSKNHASIDTFAKKLYLKGESEELRKLKIAMSIFFIVEQTRKRTDTRYDSFFASILKDHALDLPDNIRILSWNYDYQFELSYAEYSNTYDIRNNQGFLRISQENDQKEHWNGFRIIKLNGTTGLIKDDYINRMRLFVQHLDKMNFDFITELTESYAETTLNKIHPILSFAWEKHANTEITGMAKENVHDTVALVVIGYSFPFFNRDVDKTIINSMKNLKRVYFQAPDADNLKERFQALRDDLEESKLVCKYDCNQFLLPNEL